MGLRSEEIEAIVRERSEAADRERAESARREERSRDERVAAAADCSSRLLIEETAEGVTLVVPRLAWLAALGGVINPYYAWAFFFPLGLLGVGAYGLADLIAGATSLPLSVALPAVGVAMAAALLSLATWRYRPLKLQVTRGYFALWVRRRDSARPTLAGTVGQLTVRLNEVPETHSKTGDRMGLFGWVLVAFDSAEASSVEAGVVYRLRPDDAERLERKLRALGVQVKRVASSVLW